MKFLLVNLSNGSDIVFVRSVLAVDFVEHHIHFNVVYVFQRSQIQFED